MLERESRPIATFSIATFISFTRCSNNKNIKAGRELEPLSSSVSKTIVFETLPHSRIFERFYACYVVSKAVSKTKSQNKVYSASFETTEYVKIGYTLNERQGRFPCSVRIDSLFLFLDSNV